MLEDASEAEREILGAIPYQENATLLHTDTSVLPRTRRAWSSWNYRIPRTRRDRVAVSYDMNILQGFEDAPESGARQYGGSQPGASPWRSGITTVLASNGFGHGAVAAAWAQTNARVRTRSPVRLAT